MKPVFLLLLLLSAARIEAIMWEFEEEGDTQGWIAREGIMSGRIALAPLRSEVRDGIWRIAPAPRPDLALRDAYSRKRGQT